MAYNAQQIPPIDFKPSTAVGISLPFSSPEVFTSTYTTDDATKNNLINWFLTNKGERPLNPDFGGNLRQYIFEQITTNNLDFLKEDIQNQLGTYFPNIQIVSLDVLGQEDSNIINVILKYRIINTGATDELNISFT
jgi:hypothetical protein